MDRSFIRKTLRDERNYSKYLNKVFPVSFPVIMGFLIQLFTRILFPVFVFSAVMGYAGDKMMTRVQDWHYQEELAFWGEEDAEYIDEMSDEEAYRIVASYVTTGIFLIAIPFIIGIGLMSRTPGKGGFLLFLHGIVFIPEVYVVLKYFFSGRELFILEHKWVLFILIPLCVICCLTYQDSGLYGKHMVVKPQKTFKKGGKLVSKCIENRRILYKSEEWKIIYNNHIIPWLNKDMNEYPTKNVKVVKEDILRDFIKESQRYTVRRRRDIYKTLAEKYNKFINR